MSYEEIYKSKLMTADEAVAAHIKSGDKIWLGESAFMRHRKSKTGRA